MTTGHARLISTRHLSTRLPISSPWSRNSSRQLSTINRDVLVVGGGNAGFSAALSAAQTGAQNVLLIDKCPKEWAGGNSFFTAGAFRTAHAGLSDLLPIVNNVDSSTAKLIDLDPYTEEDFGADLARVTRNRYNPELGKTLISESNDAVKWLAKHGIRFQLSFNRQAYKIAGRYKFWGGMCLKTEDGGKGLLEDYFKAAEKNRVEVRHSTAVKQIILDPDTGAFKSLIAESLGGQVVINAKSIILAAGGFEANPRMRAQYLGPSWDLAHVRGTPYNTGECLEIAIRDINAKQAGNWSGCHAVAWDANSPPNGGDRQISNEFTKSGYPFGISLNSAGERFFDEGSDLRNYTYAKFGKAILAQPGGVAFQIWDAEGSLWLRDEEYRDEIVEKIHASSIAELADKCVNKGLENPGKFVATVKAYNEAVYAHRNQYPELAWDPAVLDGLSTQSSTIALDIPKSNWALPLDKPPFMAVKVGCGITFTFGGLAVESTSAGVISALTEKTIPGVYCAGEMVGGLFYGNYPGGSGLTSGTVFGRKAGASAAAWSLRDN